MTTPVFWADMRADKGSSLLDKAEQLYQKAGFAKLVSPKDLVAIKLHFGEPGNTSYVQAPYIRRMVDRIKENGGKPFLTDANTLYVGQRANAVNHLQTAIENGFAYAVVSAPLIIADGLNGKDYVNVPIHQKHFQEVKIGSAIHHADALLVISHFKGHQVVGFGGALKNLGMGSGSRGGKQMMHTDVSPVIRKERCKGCSKCLSWCPGNAITIVEQKASILPESCLGCGECTVTCPHRAIAISWKTTPVTLQEKMVEYAYGVQKEKKGKIGFINFVIGVTPDCDCFSWSDAPIVNDIGILASQDPVALDQACFDLVNRQTGLPNTRLENCRGAADKFQAIHQVDGTAQLVYGEQIGMGSCDYQLIKI
jgi:uncharacterized Fe-S center protein